MIGVHDLTFAYAETEVLKAVRFSVEPGECMALLGANGSGKSTLLTVLAGLFPPTRGEIRIKGSLSPARPAQLRRSSGLLLQEADLQILGGTVREDLCLSLQNSRIPDERPALELAERFGLKDSWETPVQQLSGGQKRKLCLAAVLLQGPELLLFDEPFSGLDYPAAREFRAILQDNRRQGITQIVALHDLEPVLDLLDGCLVLHQGRLVLLGGLDEVRDRLAGFGIRAPGAGWSAGGPCA
ncbi:MAG: energy-coupling factor ABC transporter ATP-binding protein [Desulfohalobiaceae bacterium]|nr:energy-coupling factor ABC transporter ATP-binding protein [Desulfohalobiaceae bacterium]